MTSADLDAIRGRLAKISKWPWSVDESFDVIGQNIVGPYATRQTIVVGTDLQEGLPIAKHSDLEFIAHAPDDIVALLADVDRLNEVKEVMIADVRTLTTRLARARDILKEIYESDVFFVDTGDGHRQKLDKKIRAALAELDTLETPP